MIKEAANTDGVLLHVNKDGDMFCSVDKIQLRPTPGWLCRQVIIQVGQREMEAALGHDSCIQPMPERTLYREGLLALRDAAPCVLSIPFEMLHAREEEPS